MADLLVLKQIIHIFMQDSAEKLTGALSPDGGSGNEGGGVAWALDPLSIAEEEPFCIFFLLFFCCCESKWPKRKEVTSPAQSKVIFFLLVTSF